MEGSLALFHYICQYGTVELFDDLAKELGDRISICYVNTPNNNNNNNNNNTNNNTNITTTPTPSTTMTRPNEWNPLILFQKLVKSISEANPEAIRLYLRLGVDPNNIYTDKKTPFHYAVGKLQRC